MCVGGGGGGEGGEGGGSGGLELVNFFYKESKLKKKQKKIFVVAFWFCFY